MGHDDVLLHIYTCLTTWIRLSADMGMRALVLSGGGVKGAYQVGALKKWLYEDGLDYDIVCGVSVGAINVAVLSQEPRGQSRRAWERLVGLWERVENGNVRKNWCLGKISSLWKPAIYNSQPLLDWIDREVDPAAVAASGRQVRVGVVSWDTGENRFVPGTDPNFAKWVAASASYPVFLLPVEIVGQVWTDGGVRNVTPLGEAIRLGATDIDVIMCSNPDARTPFSARGKAAIPSLAVRTLDLMSDQIMRTDLQVCGLKNDLAQLGGPYRNVRIRLVQPKTPLVEDPLDFDPVAIADMMDRGYADALALG